MNLLPTPTAARAGRQRSASEGAAIRPTLDSIGALLPTPKASNNENRLSAGYGPNLGQALLPTPRASDGAKGGPNQRGSSGDLMLPSAVALLPTPSVADSTGGHERRGGDRGGELLLKGIASHEQFGKYAAAVDRWARIFGPAPSPTEPGKTRPRLNPDFASWMMGAPPGWITEVPGLTRNQQLHAIGNGVVPQQAIAALTVCLHRLSEGSA